MVMRRGIRRGVLIFSLILGVLTISTVLLLLVDENHQKSTESAVGIQEKESLVREIRAYSARKNTKVKAMGPRVNIEVKKKRQEPTKEFVQSSLPETYSVVSVVPELKKESYASTQSTQTVRTSVEEEHLTWLISPTAIDDLVNQASGRDQTYGLLQINRPVEIEQIRQILSEFNTRVLGNAGDLVRLQVPNDKEVLRSILDLSWVNGIGALPSNQKISKSFQEEVNSSVLSEQLPVFVSVVDSELEQKFRRTLEEIGVSVGHFDPTIRVFAAVINPGQVDEITRLDFVQAIEPIHIVTAVHDTAVPAQGVDKLRTIGDLSGTFSGITGSTTPIAVMDTGLNANHVDISTLRESICAKNFVENEDSDLYFDANGHGTHVTGTVAGNGFFVPKYAGMAPGVQHIRFAKVLNLRGAGSSADILQGMDFLAEESSCVFEGHESGSVRPLIVNMSLSAA